MEALDFRVILIVMAARREALTQPAVDTSLTDFCHGVRMKYTPSVGNPGPDNSSVRFLALKMNDFAALLCLRRKTGTGLAQTWERIDKARVSNTIEVPLFGGGR
jgi:hypothetical protein